HRFRVTHKLFGLFTPSFLSQLRCLLTDRAQLLLNNLCSIFDPPTDLVFVASLLKQRWFQQTCPSKDHRFRFTQELLSFFAFPFLGKRLGSLTDRARLCFYILRLISLRRAELFLVTPRYRFRFSHELLGLFTPPFLGKLIGPLAHSR